MLAYRLMGGGGPKSLAQLPVDELIRYVSTHMEEAAAALTVCLARDGRTYHASRRLAAATAASVDVSRHIELPILSHGVSTGFVAESPRKLRPPTPSPDHVEEDSMSCMALSCSSPSVTGGRSPSPPGRAEPLPIPKRHAGPPLEHATFTENKVTSRSCAVDDAQPTTPRAAINSRDGRSRDSSSALAARRVLVAAPVLRRSVPRK